MTKLEEYKTDWDELARIVAQMTSGIKGAIPEEADFVIAREVIDFIEKRIRES